MSNVNEGTVIRPQVIPTRTAPDAAGAAAADPWGARLDLAPLRAALATLNQRDPQEFVQAALIQAVGNLGRVAEPTPEPLTMAHLRQIAGFFQEGLARCQVLELLLAGRVAIVPGPDGALQTRELAPVPTAPGGATVPQEETNDGVNQQPAGRRIRRRKTV